MRQQTKPLFIQIMVCNLLGATALSEQMLIVTWTIENELQ